MALNGMGPFFHHILLMFLSNVFFSPSKCYNKFQSLEYRVEWIGHVDLNLFD